MSLESWNNTPTKQAILDFVAAASAEGGPGFIPPADRIAAFDNDGTLWVEQPAPDGPFALALRIYWPEQDVLDGSWEPSAIQKA